jgi:hypothetical protein
MSVRKYEILSNVYGLRLRCPFRFSARPGATLLEHIVVVVVFHKQGLYMHALQARSGPGLRHSSFYFHVALTVTDTGFVTLTVTQINQQELDINPPQADKC